VRFTLLRNATALLDFGGQHFLIDPALDDAGARPPIPNTPNPHANPLVPLPDDWRQVIAEASAHLVTHLHQDHFDQTAARTLSHALPLICQPDDVERLRELGFSHLEPVESEIEHHGVRLTRTGGHHGTGEIGAMLAPVSGFVFEGEGEPTTYVAGDTVWCEEVAGAIDRFRPRVIVLNAGGARFLTGDPITMTAEDIAAVAEVAPDAELIVVHLEAINHCVESRAWYRERLPRLGVELQRVHLLPDGETMSLA
jgi:L-ascorbate metabolism protein UlaG (beta-lactamase superfamily)